MMGIFSAVLKKLLGSRYERILKNIVFLLLFYFAWDYSEITLPISYPVFLLMTMGLTFGVVLQLIQSDDMAKYLKGQFMLPFRHTAFNTAYCAAAVVYTLVTKTAVILVLYIASCQWNPLQIAGFLLCFLNACLAAFCCAACFIRQRKAAALIIPVISVMLCFYVKNIGFQISAVGVYTLVLLLILLRTNSYAYCTAESFLKQPRHIGKVGGHLAIMIYLARYMMAHKNYLINTLIMWAFGGVFAVILGKIGYEDVMPLGFAVLSMNTPVSILLSGDKSLYYKVETLPGQSRRFFVPYGEFIGLCNFSAYAIYLICWRLINGSFNLVMMWTAVLFAVESGILLVFMEQRHPITNWKTEADLWHHPRKYAVPLAMTVLAVLVSAFWGTIYILTAFTAVQCALIARSSFQNEKH